MSGATDLSAMLSSLTVSVRPDDYVVVALDAAATVPGLGDGVEAVINEGQGPTVIATIERAKRDRWPYAFVASWITLEIHSALEAVGLTRAFSTALAQAGIPCNVLAGYYHDHILVPHDKRDSAVAAIESLRKS